MVQAIPETRKDQPKLLAVRECQGPRRERRLTRKILYLGVWCLGVAKRDGVIVGDGR